jgi:hypothetical protein
MVSVQIRVQEDLRVQLLPKCFQKIENLTTGCNTRPTQRAWRFATLRINVHDSGKRVVGGVAPCLSQPTCWPKLFSTSGLLTNMTLSHTRLARLSRLQPFRCLRFRRTAVVQTERLRQRRLADRLHQFLHNVSDLHYTVSSSILHDQ